MSKFHVNEKGEPGKCTAEVACPFGSDDKHYPSPEIARQAYEENNSHQNIPTLTKRVANFLRGEQKPAIPVSEYDNRDFDNLLYDQVTFEEEYRANRLRKQFTHSYPKRSSKEREGMVQRALIEERGRWYREAETEPVVSFQRQAPLRMVPAGVEIMGDDGEGGRMVIGRVESPSVDDSGNLAACYTDAEGNMRYVDPNYPVDVGEVPEADPEEPWGPWEREKRHAIRLSKNRKKFDEMSQAIRAKNGS